MNRERLLRAAVYAIGVSLTAYTLYFAYVRPFVRVRHANLFLGAGLSLFYLNDVLEHIEKDDDVAGESDRGRIRAAIARIDPAIALLSAGAAVAATAYVEHNFTRLYESALVVGYTQLDFVVGAVIIALVTDATRRAYGWAITGVVLASLGYAFWGPYLPGIFHHSGMTGEQVIRHGAISLSGVYGFILGVGTTWVAIFIMFAGLAKAYGLLDFILDIGAEISKVIRTGVVHIAVIASMAMGSITGSAAANTATTGSFTIPMMQRQGVRDDYAAAIESVASSGGQIMPPVMGVAAFLMADILGISYVRVLQAGLLPAALFYFSVGVAVHLAILKFGWTSERTGQFDSRVLLDGIHFAIPLAVLLYTLVEMRLTPLSAGLYTTLAIIPTVFVTRFLKDGLDLKTLLDATKRTVVGLKQGAVDMAPLVGVLASMGIIIKMLTQTGLSQKISLQMVALSGGVLVGVLLIAMVTSILFGLGMPTPAAYLMVVILVAPGVVEMGVSEITAHMFVFYFAMLSAITPPVAIAVAVGSRIADTEFMLAAKQAIRLGAPGFFIPFAFVTNQQLIDWAFPGTVVELAVVLVGVVSLSVATTGCDGRNRLYRSHRAGYFAMAALALYGPRTVQVTATALTLLALALTHTERIPKAIRPEEI